MSARRLVLLFVVACAVLPASASAGLIALRIEFRGDAGSQPRVLTLRCAEKATGTVPNPAAACSRLQRMGRADLIGNGPDQLIPHFQPAGTGHAAEGARAQRFATQHLGLPTTPRLPRVRLKAARVKPATSGPDRSRRG